MTTHKIQMLKLSRTISIDFGNNWRMIRKTWRSQLIKWDCILYLQDNVADNSELN